VRSLMSASNTFATLVQLIVDNLSIQLVAICFQNTVFAVFSVAITLVL